MNNDNGPASKRRAEAATHGPGPGDQDPHRKAWMHMRRAHIEQVSLVRLLQAGMPPAYRLFCEERISRLTEMIREIERWTHCRTPWEGA